MYSGHAHEGSIDEPFYYRGLRRCHIARLSVRDQYAAHNSREPIDVQRRFNLVPFSIEWSSALGHYPALQILCLYHLQGEYEPGLQVMDVALSNLGSIQTLP